MSRGGGHDWLQVLKYNHQVSVFFSAHLSSAVFCVSLIPRQAFSTVEGGQEEEEEGDSSCSARLRVSFNL